MMITVLSLADHRETLIDEILARDDTLLFALRSVCLCLAQERFDEPYCKVLIVRQQIRACVCVCPLRVASEHSSLVGKQASSSSVKRCQ